MPESGSIGTARLAERRYADRLCSFGLAVCGARKSFETWLVERQPAAVVDGRLQSTAFAVEILGRDLTNSR